jgi:rhodanese-related sulfurtransferase
MSFFKSAVIALTLSLALSLPLSLPLSRVASAAPEPEDPKKQTPWGLYLTSSEAFAMKQEKGDAVLFVDVREPVEIMFTGFTDVVDVNIPFLLVNPAQWHPTKPVLMMEKNTDFAPDILAALEARNLDKSTPVILMCRSGGTRGAPSARALEGTGLENVYVVVDGFEGTTRKGDPNGPWRLVNGWKNSGLPWGYALNPDKIYLRSQD